MPKRNGVAGKAPTHFETVPLEVVKVIAVEDLPNKNLLKPVPTRAPAGKKR